MAVSLKKRVKVDLSKPELSPRLRENNPVHILDEAETINPLSETEIVPSKCIEPILQADDVSERVRQIKLECDNNFVRFRFSRGLIIFCGILVASGICLLLVSLLFALPDLLSFLLPSDGSEEDLGSIMRAVLTQPIVILSVVLSCVGFGVRFILKVLNVGRF